jgi:Uma2 family endonuclease
MTASTLAEPTVYTASDLERLSDAGYHFELIQGGLHEMAPPGGTHGSSTSRLATFVGILVIDKVLGETFVAETGFNAVRSERIGHIGRWECAAGLFCSSRPPFSAELSRSGAAVTG